MKKEPGTDPRFAVLKTARFKGLAAKKKKICVSDSRFRSFFESEEVNTAIDPRTGQKRKVAEFGHIYGSARRESSPGVEGRELRRSGSKKRSQLQASADEADAKDFVWERDTATTESEDESSLTDENQEDSVWDAFDGKQVETTETGSRRLALIGLDWEVVNASDLFLLFSSVLKSCGSGSIERVAIYMSNLGAERVDYESEHGPIMLSDSVEPERGQERCEDSITQDEAAVEEFRKYRRLKSRYYYAVIQCDNELTASKLYQELDGVDCEFAVDLLDLRFVPDSYEPFTNEHPRKPISVVEGSVPRGYKPSSAFVSFMKHSKLSIDWDDDSKARLKKCAKTFNQEQMADLDMKDYLATSSDDGTAENAEQTSLSPMTLEEIDLPECYKSCETLPSRNPAPADPIDQFKRGLLTELTLIPRGSPAAGPSSKTGKATKRDEDEGCFEIIVSGGHQDASRSEAVLSSSERPRSGRRASRTEPQGGGRSLDRSAAHGEAEGNSDAEERPGARRDAPEERPATTSGNAKRRKLSKAQKQKEKRLRSSMAYEQSTSEIGSILEDRRFSELLSNREFQIDPTHPKFKASLLSSFSQYAAWSILRDTGRRAARLSSLSLDLSRLFQKTKTSLTLMSMKSRKGNALSR